MPRRGAPGELQVCGRGLVPEPARAEVHADPHGAVLVGEQVDVVVAGADGAELVGGEVVQRALGARVGGADRVEHRMVDRLVVAAADAERDPRHDRVHDPRQFGRDLRAPQVGPHGLVAAADVVADARDRDVVAVRDRAADRLAVADVPVGAQDADRAVLGRHAALELRDGRSSWSPITVTDMSPRDAARPLSAASAGGRRPAPSPRRGRARGSHRGQRPASRDLRCRACA